MLCSKTVAYIRLYLMASNNRETIIVKNMAGGMVWGILFSGQPPNLGLRLYVNASWQVDNIPDMTVEPDTVYMHVGCVSKHGVECVGRISEVVVDRQSLILEPWSSLDLAAHGNISGNFMLRHVLEQEAGLSQNRILQFVIISLGKMVWENGGQESKSQELNFRKETLCLCSCHCRVNEMVANGRHTFCQQ